MTDTLSLSTQTIQDIQNASTSLNSKDYINLFALFLSPLVAVLVGQYLQEIKIKKEAKASLFRTLFSLRGQAVNHYYVNALNQIDVVFHKNKDVLDAWHKLYDSLNDLNIRDKMKNDNDFRIAKNKEWDNLRNEILIQMALVVGYNLKVMKPEYLLNPAYSPEGHAFVENFEWDLKYAAKEYFETSIEFQRTLANFYVNNPPVQSTRKDDQG